MNTDDANDIPVATPVADTDGPVDPAFVDDFDGNPPPRLGIIHFLAWITIAAVLFGIDSLLTQLEHAPGRAAKFVIHRRGLDFISLSAISAGIVGLVTLMRLRNRGGARPLAPGHRILIIEAFALLIGNGIETGRRAISLFVGLADDRFTYVPTLAIYVLITATQFALFIAAVGKSKPNRGWDGVFIILAIACMTQLALDSEMILVNLQVLRFFGVVEVIYVAPVLVHTIAALTLLIYAIYDIVHVRRDWLHGLGVSLVFVNAVMWVGYWIASRLVR